MATQTWVRAKYPLLSILLLFLMLANDYFAQTGGRNALASTSIEPSQSKAGVIPPQPDQKPAEDIEPGVTIEVEIPSTKPAVMVEKGDRVDLYASRKDDASASRQARLFRDDVVVLDVMKPMKVEGEGPDSPQLMVVTLACDFKEGIDLLYARKAWRLELLVQSPKKIQVASKSLVEARHEFDVKGTVQERPENNLARKPVGRPYHLTAVWMTTEAISAGEEITIENIKFVERPCLSIMDKLLERREKMVG